MRLTSLRAWYRSDLGITLSGSDVTAWADQSGNGNHLTDGATASRRPAYSASDAAFGGKPSLTFDGVAEWLSDTALSLGGDTSLFSLWMVYRQIGYTSGDVIALYNVGGNNRPALLQHSTANTISWLPAGGAGLSFTTTTFNDGVTRLVGGTWDSSTGRIYVGATQEDFDANAGADFADGGAFALGATTAGGVPASFAVSELIIQRATTSTLEATNINAYTRRLYGTP